MEPLGSMGFIWEVIVGKIVSKVALGGHGSSIAKPMKNNAFAGFQGFGTLQACTKAGSGCVWRPVWSSVVLPL